ncbi:hypothetical protein K440DRAFT_596393 [Wilcoxina mikolae CBS 423.85]|nr:hypothetical protein K440DRAFT_596393 [Wilcoxina mikolae CBS 423.85]
MERNGTVIFRPSRFQVPSAMVRFSNSRAHISPVVPRQETRETIRSDELDFLINHIFLPPKLPQGEESSIIRKDRNLVKVLKAAAEKYRANVEEIHAKERMAIVCNMLSSILAIKSSGQGAISATILSEKICAMKFGDVIALEISAQNAGIVLRHAYNEMVFEMFELSPTPAEVTGTAGRLRCSYPGPAIAVGIETAKDPAFAKNLALFLEDMDIEELEQVVPVIKKAGSNMPEFRDTNDPMFITSMLSGILRGLGRPVDSDELRIQKNIRDDVLYLKARAPWRRSPLWLLLRVVLQTTLRDGDDHGLYKSFMAYFMADVLEQALRSVSGSETLFVMNAKLARRVLKAGDSLPTFVKKRVEDVVGQVSQHIEKEWERIQGNNPNSNRWNPTRLSFEGDTKLSLCNSKTYLDGVLNRNKGYQTQSTFRPKEIKRISGNSDKLPSLNKGGKTGFELLLMLGDFESWVEHNLGGWQSANISRESACQEIGDIIKQYTNIAKELYDNSPENLSIMLLTTMELWVALDKITLRHCGLMAQYSPEIPENLLNPLLLRKRKEMVRLNEVETYIRNRQDWADRYDNPQILSENSGSNAFAVRFFETSPSHRQLASQIEAQAQNERAAKEAEYHRRTKEYDDLMRKRDDMSCSYFWKVNRRGRGRNAHSPGCARCALEKQAGNMRIGVHEWPLPSSELKKKVAVFELQRPTGFSVWRDITYLILVDVCTPTKFVSETAAGGNIARYSSLQSHYSSTSRVTLSSKKKCFLNAHYKERSFPTQLESICVNNGLGYQLYDQDQGGWVEGNLKKWDVRPMCTFQLPPGSYKNMQYALDNTIHTANSVIASQAYCSTELTLHEYEAFGELRSGHLLQWMNIARELRSRNLTWVNEEVGILLMQAVWQVGPNDSGLWYRESHLDPVDPTFGKTLLDEIHEVWTRIRDNWREINSAHSLILLTTRILSLSTSENIKDTAVELLKEARKITHDWTRQLVGKLDKGENLDEKTIQNLRLRLIQVSATCRATYDVDSADLRRVLGSDDRDLEIVIECAIILHDNVPTKVNCLSPLMRALLERDRRLSWNLESELRAMILQTQTCQEMNNCIKHIWSAYVSGGCWEALKTPNDRWVVTKTSSDAKVQYNLLTGQLLVNSTPLKRLPPEYKAHATYLRTFGDKVFDVCPGDGGMCYQSKKEYNGFQLSFSLESTELLIRAKKYGRTLELIPHSRLHGDFPKHLVENYAHWMDVRSGRIEFRPLESQWVESCHNPWVSYSDLVMRCSCEGRRFLDVRSTSARMIYSVLGPLEYSDYVEITIANSGEVEINLPRFQMVFFLNESKQLECRQFRDMIVDENQSFGTLTGLRNRLVLRNKGRGRDSHCRKVLIPYGKVAYGIVGSHVEVTICTKEDKTVVYHHFDVDTTLWRLSGSGGLSTRLYKIYLHALTSHCLPDPLTGRTGTEEALYDLNSAAVWSFKELEAVDLDLLNHIAELTPARLPYPKHLRKMQTVSWNDLPPLSQHEDFYRTVQRILEYNSRFEFFQDHQLPTSKVETRETEPYLVDKAAMRNRAFRAEDFGGLNVALEEDRTYVSRDVPSGDAVSLESKVCAMARNTNNWSTSLNTAPDLLQRFENWNRLKGNEAKIPLGYNSRWVKEDLSDVWCSLYDACRTATRKDRYSLMFLFAPMIYHSEGPTDMQLVWTLLAFATIPKFERIKGPDYDSYVLGIGYQPNSDILPTVQRFAVDCYSSKEWSEPQRMHESMESWYDRREQLYDDHLKSQTNGLVNWYQSQWVREVPAVPAAHTYPLLKVNEMRDAMNSLFHNCYKNLQFKNHIQEVQQVLDLARSNRGDFPTYVFSPCETTTEPSPYISIADLSIDTAQTRRLSNARSIIIRRSQSNGGNTQLDDGRLEGLLDNLKEESKSDFEKGYMEDLLKSLSAFRRQAETAPNWGTIRDQQLELLERFRLRCKSRLDSMFSTIREKLGLPRVDDYTRELLRMAGLWPRITPASLLGLLAKRASVELELRWKKTLVDYAVAMTDFQRATRLNIVALAGNHKELVKEAENPGHKDWNPMEYPDWILLEIENNLLIRPIQANIASRMIAPRFGRSAVLQLNMGEGKSSVIVPIVSAALADGDKLVRVVVLKPLSTQMFRLLVQKLGGLTGRRIFYMPFNRDIKVDPAIAKKIRGLYEECMRTMGILLVQPEHLLSFKLMGFEQLEHRKKAGDKSGQVAKELLDTSRWLEEKARDILDESDEILHVRYQLIYTLGKQNWLDHSPDRWVILQDLFHLVREHAAELREEYPKGVEIQGVSPGCFPQIRILEDKAGKKLLDNLVHDIRSGKLPHLSVRLWSNEARQLASEFIQDSRMSKENSERLFSLLDNTSMRSGSDSDKKTLLLLRGMIAHGILLTALRDRRWRVDYGLDEKRSPPTLLAVPYRAKDSPALRAEFSHPDMAITLTCLSYYYGGLTDSQLEVSFAALLKSNNPPAEYQRWVGNDPAVSESIRTLSGVNIDDFEQRSTLVFPQLRNRKCVIDFYLSQVVFPKDAKEFPHKLSTSGWDLAEERTLPTTGFSGTNDNRFLLPLSLEQDDVPENEGTNAKVLHYLLKSENDHYQDIKAGDDKVNVLLEMVVKQDPKIRVILDVGAQILLKNEVVAKKLLELGQKTDPPPQAVVYFDDRDEIIVQKPDGSTELLLFSPFAKQLDNCFVYLDEAHTRGTDLKLPIGSRAAVTLGPKLTKDRLVQGKHSVHACMRMRQLGDGHTVMFFAPTEVHQKILDISRQRLRNPGAIDVVEWAIGETCIAIKNSVPLWASQGLSYHKRQNAWLEYWKKGSSVHKCSNNLLTSLRERESQILEELYSPLSDSTSSSAIGGGFVDKKIIEIRKKCDYFGIENLHGVRTQEEQEREVAQETEQEKSVERPPPATPADHSLHHDVIQFVTSGKVPEFSSGVFMPAFSIFNNTTAPNPDLRGWSEKLLVTRDFARTIVESNSKLDEYLRPVNWVLSSRDPSIYRQVIISPYEANKLLPRIRDSKFVRLHVYAPRVAEDMKTFESMDVISIPPVPCNSNGTDLDLMGTNGAIELNIFAGQLCLSSYEQYKNVCSFLGLHLGSVGDEDEGYIDSEGGFMSPARRRELGISSSPFEQNPVSRIKSFIMFRRKGQDYLETHMGKLLRGVQLFEKDFS